MPNTKVEDFDFQGEIQQLPYTVNLGTNAKLKPSVQAKFTDILCNNQKVS